EAAARPIVESPAPATPRTAPPVAVATALKPAPPLKPPPMPAALASLGLHIPAEIAEKNRRARQRMLQARLERGRPSREAAYRRILADLEKLKNSLTVQIEQNAWKAAHATVAAMLAINPEDPDALDTQAFVKEQLAI